MRDKRKSNRLQENFSMVRNLRTYGWKEIFHKGKFSSDRRKIKSPPLVLKKDDWKLQFSINGNAIILKTKKVSNWKNKKKTIDTTNWIKPYSDENMKNGE